MSAENRIDESFEAMPSRAWGKPRGLHSRLVGLMRFVLPGLALALLTIVIVWPQLQNRDGGFRLGFADKEAFEAESLRMVNPRYAGLDRNSLPYQVTADTASQASPKSDVILLENPKADMTLSDGTWVALAARDGVYGQKSELLDLSGGVNLFHDSGYEFNSASARIDLARGIAEGRERTTGQGPHGEVEADGFRLLDKGKTIVFTGRARLVLYPQQTAGGRPDGGGR